MVFVGWSVRSAVSVGLMSAVMTLAAAQERLPNVVSEPQPESNRQFSTGCSLPAEGRGSVSFRSAMTKAIERRGYDQTYDMRVIGGHFVTQSDYPWQVALLLACEKDPFFALFCGGVYIGDGWVLTAAHCVTNGLTVADIDVFWGNERLEIKDGGKRVPVKWIHPHRQFNVTPHENDIAIVRLAESLATLAIFPVDAASEAALSAEDKKLDVSGWGDTQERGVRSAVLQAVSVSIRAASTCKASYPGKFSEKMICAGERQGGLDACHGDSGGPAVVHPEGGGSVLLALVSWGEGCGQEKKYGVYTRIAPFAGWIADAKECYSAPEKCKD